MTGEAGITCLVERSTNLHDWTSIATITVPVDGAAIWTGLVPVEGATGFFRVRLE